VRRGSPAAADIAQVPLVTWACADATGMPGGSHVSAVYSRAMEQLAGPDGGVYLVSASRTPIGKFGGVLAGVPAVELGATAIRAAVERSGLPSDAEVAEVVMGQVLQAGVGQAPARQAWLRAGLADTSRRPRGTPWAALGPKRTCTPPPG